MGPEAGDAGRGDVHNTMSGTAGAVVQAGTVRDVNLTVQHAGPPPPRDGGVPRQLPPVTVRVVNQNRPLADLAALAAGRPDGPPRLVVVTGMRGVGKTTVARAAAARLPAERFPGGALYVDFAAWRTAGDTAVSDALAACLNALGVHASFLPATLAERTAQYRTLTADKPLLVVLDDVTEPAQVLPLVPAARGSAVLVTSDDELGELRLDGAEVIEVDTLDEPHAVELLADLCGRRRCDAEPDAVRELVRYCGGLPLALRVAAARLVTRPRLAVSALVAELRDERRRLAALSLRGEQSVSAVFSIGYQGLTPDAALLYRRLGAFPGPRLTVDAAVALAGLPAAEVDGLLDALITAHLLAVDAEGDIRFHDLVRLHAAERARAEDDAERRRAAASRLITYYRDRLAFADRAVMGDRLRIADYAGLFAAGPDPFAGADPAETALDWLEQQRPNLLGLQRLAAEYGWHDLGWQLAETATAFFLNRRYLHEWIESSELGISAAELSGNVAAEARLRTTVSRPLLDLGERERASSHLDRALPLAEQSGNLTLQASVWEFRGRYFGAADPDAAVAAYRTSLDLNERIGEARGAALARLFLGDVLVAAGDVQGGLDELHQAVTALRGLGDGRMAARAQAALGKALVRRGDLASAAAALTEAADALGRRGYLHYEAEAREALADVADRQGDRAAAREHLRRVVQIHEGFGGPRVAELTAALHRLGAATGR